MWCGSWLMPMTVLMLMSQSRSSSLTVTAKNVNLRGHSSENLLQGMPYGRISLFQFAQQWHPHPAPRPSLSPRFRPPPLPQGSLINSSIPTPPLHPLYKFIYTCVCPPIVQAI